MADAVLTVLGHFHGTDVASCSSTIHHTIVQADDWHVLVNKHTHKKYVAVDCTPKARNILLRVNLGTHVAAQ